MTLLRPPLALLALLLAAALLQGCPQPPLLQVNPSAVTFGATGTDQALTILNTGDDTLDWAIEEVVRADESAPWVAGDIAWLSATPASGATDGATDRVELAADRSGEAVGLRNNSGIRIVSNGGTTVIPVSMTVAPSLTVSPTDFAISSGVTTAQFSTINGGAADVQWDVQYLADPDDPASAEPLPADVTVTPNPGVTAPATPTVATVEWSAARNEDFSLILNSAGGDAVLRFRFGAALDGLSVNPAELTLFVDTLEVPEGQDSPEQTPSTLEVINSDSIAHTWAIELRSLINPAEIPAIAATPSGSTTPAGETTDVAVVVTDVSQIVAGSGNYELVLREDDSFLTVPLTIEVMALPEIAISDPPQETSSRPEINPIEVLDFGKEDLQKTFWIANVGPLSSDLYFNITYHGQGNVSPVIAAVNPLQGDTNADDEDFFHPTESNILIDGVPVVVTVDRSAMTEEVEFHTITVTATDPLFEDSLEAVAPQTLQVRVERPPLKVEGAINRSRPPYVMRFVFLLRDTLGEVIPTQTPEDLARLTFSVTEDDVPLDIDETSLYIDGPENLKVNLVLMLDYTGSMYQAGTGDATDPLVAGEAIAQVNAAAKEFLDDLPQSYRVALMYYYDRQQPNRLLNAFTTDRETLKAALDDFELPPALHGVSDIRDALAEAVTRLVAEDAAETLPFDDADVRAVVFVSDGRDNASVATLGELTDFAADSRVRLYPLAYSAGGETGAADLLVMAEDTGGHVFNAGDVRNLVKLLANDEGLALSPSAIEGENHAYFKVSNIGDAPLLWSIEEVDDIPWIDSISPAGSVLSQDATVTATINLIPSALSPNSAAEALLALSSNNGEGSVKIRMEVGADTSVADSIRVDLRDAPGKVWNELQNQLVLTYITPLQEGSTYAIRAEYRQDDGTSVTGFFEEDAVFFPGEVIAGSIAMNTTGIFEDPNATVPEDQYRAEVYVRTDYAPRNVKRFRLRFHFLAPEELSEEAWQAFLDNVTVDVEIAPEGPLTTDDPFAPTWRIIASGDGIFDLLTQQDNPLPYGAAGNLLKISIGGLAPFVAATANPEVFLDMRADNDIYFSPATPERPSETLYFLYPSGPTFPNRPLAIRMASDLAPPARDAFDLAFPGIDPEAPSAWDRDEDLISDFSDPYPDDEGLPGAIAVPNPLEISSDQDSAEVLLRNNRLDTFTWTASLTFDPLVDPSLEGRLTLDAPGNGTSLAPAEETTLTVTVDRTGLESALYEGATLVIHTDVFGVEEVPIAVVVTP